MNSYKNLIALVFIIITSALLGGVYGAIHDQFSYTISPEYYTKFKFIQFNIQAIPNRLAVTIVGVLATWWFGAIMGIVLGVIVFPIKSIRTMLRITIKAMGIIIGVAFGVGLLGLLYGKIFLTGRQVDDFNGWFIPDNIIDLDSFVMVGSMHNFSYAGGLIGLILGIIFAVRQKRLQNI